DRGVAADEGAVGVAIGAVALEIAAEHDIAAAGGARGIDVSAVEGDLLAEDLDGAAATFGVARVDGAPDINDAVALSFDLHFASRDGAAGKEGGAENIAGAHDGASAASVDRTGVLNARVD